MTTAIPTNTHRRRTWDPLPSPLRPTASRRLMVYIGAPQPGEPGFVRCFLVVGSLREAQDEANRASEGRAVPYIADVMSGERWTRPWGQGWWEVGGG